MCPQKDTLTEVCALQVTCRAPYIRTNKTGACHVSIAMATLVPVCRLCRIPLNGKDQFLGHQMLSHELTAEAAEREWEAATETMLLRR